MNRTSPYYLSEIATTGPDTILSKLADGMKLDDHGIPVPPLAIMQYNEAPEAHLFTGQRDYDILRRALPDDLRLTRVLDYTCGNGRVLRHFASDKTVEEAWGADIDARRITWAMLNFPKPFCFATVTSAPHLPFGDGYFDLVSGYSIFTHFDELFAAWLQELRRILRVGGHLFVTIHDEDCAGKSISAKDMMGNLFTDVEAMAGFFTEDTAATYYRHQNGLLFTAFKASFFLSQVERHFGVAKVVPNAMGRQTGYLLRRER